MTEIEIKKEIIAEILKRFPTDSELSERNEVISNYYTKTLPEAKLINEILTKIYNKIANLN